MSVAVLSTNRPRLARRVRLEWDSVRERHVLLAPEGVHVESVDLSMGLEGLAYSLKSKARRK